MWRSITFLKFLVCVLQAGLKLIQRDPNVFKCYDSPWDTRYHSESGASLALLNAKYNIDTLMLRYQGIDWRKVKGRSTS